MGRMGRRLPAFCRCLAATRVSRRAKRVSSKLTVSFIKKNGGVGGGGGDAYHGSKREAEVSDGVLKKDGGGRRVMVVADVRPEAKGALQWALSHAVQDDDTVVLVSVVKPPSDGGDSCVKISKTRCYEHLDAMRNLCESRRPEVKVELCVVEAEERGPAIVEAARRHGASLLVLGQRQRRAGAGAWWRLLMLWPAGGRRGGGGAVDYCVEHAPCTALGVRRRSSGGYLITSKRHKDFWLLA